MKNRPSFRGKNGNTLYIQTIKSDLPTPPCPFGLAQAAPLKTPPGPLPPVPPGHLDACRQPEPGVHVD